MINYPYSYNWIFLQVTFGVEMCATGYEHCLPRLSILKDAAFNKDKPRKTAMKWKLINDKDKCEQIFILT